MKWEMVKLGDQCEVKTGKFDVNHSIEDGLFPFFTCAFLPFKCNTFSFEGELILLPGNGANVGEVFYYNGKAEAYQRTYVLSEFKAHPKYIYYFLKGCWKQKLSNKQYGSATNYIRLDNITDAIVPLPPLATQKRIAEILDKADALRQKDQALLRKYDELAKAVFVDMFGDPVKNEKGWEVGTIGSVCTSVKDGPHVSPKYTEKGIPFISVNNIIGGEIDLSKTRYISQQDFELYSTKSKPEYGDILYTKGGTTGFAKRIDVNYDFMNWVHIAVLKFNRNLIHSIFFEYMLNNEYCYNQSQKYTRGIANRDLVLGEMKKITILLPPMDSQIQFSKRITLIESQEKISENNYNHSESLFQSLLQKAFTGELVA